MANPEVKTMNECTFDLVTGLEAIDVEEVADALKGLSLLAGDVYDGLSLPTKTKKQKARDIVKSVSSKVKVNPKVNFMKFLGVLESQDDLDVLVKKLEEKYGESSYNNIKQWSNNITTWINVATYAFPSSPLSFLHSLFSVFLFSIQSRKAAN